MDKQDFWDLIAKSNASPVNQFDSVVEKLNQKNDQDMADFDYYYLTYMYGADQEGVRETFRSIMNDDSHDSFDVFLSWLVAQGQDIYMNVLNHPESLANDDFNIHLAIKDSPYLEHMNTLGLRTYFIKHSGCLDWNDELYDSFEKLLLLTWNANGQTLLPNSIEKEDREMNQDTPSVIIRFGDSSRSSHA